MNITYNRLQEQAQYINECHQLDSRRRLVVKCNKTSFDFTPAVPGLSYQLVDGSRVPLTKWVNGKIMQGVLSGIQIGLGIKTRATT